MVTLVYVLSKSIHSVGSMSLQTSIYTDAEHPKDKVKIDKVHDLDFNVT